MSTSLSQQLHYQTLNAILERFDLNEVTAEGGGAYLPLISQAPMVQGSIGQVRVFKGSGLTQLVSCTIVVPPIGLDSHMLFAFTDTESGLPHFTVDSVRNGDTYAFHLDLIPRLDLAVSLAYMDEVFAPLSETFTQHKTLDGLSPAQLDPRQLAVMSPWMLVNRADEPAFKATFGAVQAYLEQWFSLMDKGLSEAALEGSTAQSRAARDDAHRAVIFNPEVDKVWNQITPLLGQDTVNTIISLLRATRG